MKKVFYLFIVFIISFLAIKCNDKNENNSKINKDYSKNERVLVNIGNNSKELYFSFPRVKDVNSKRIWKKINLRSKVKIGGINSEILYFPTNIKIDQYENIYVLDWKGHAVKKFNQDGVFIEKFGKKGKGPGEFTKVFNFDVDNDGTVAIISPNDNKFTVFKNENIYEFKCKLMPGNICFIAPNEVVTFQFMDILTESPIQKVNFIDNTITEYQNFFNKSSFSGKDFGMLPFLVGEIHRYKSNNLIYISSIMGYVILYSESGKIKNVFKLIDGVKESGLNKNERRVGETKLQLISFPKIEDYLFLSANVYDDRLFVMSNQYSNREGEYVVDIYSLNEFCYKYSILLENIDKINHIFFSNNKIYITKENTEVEILEYSFVNS